MRTAKQSVLTLSAIALVTGGLLSGCEKKTTTTTTPTGTATTTTVSPTASAATTADRVGDAASDAALTAKVKTALLADDEVKGLRIDVDTRNGVVTLNGTADTAAHVSRAETVAKGVDGVKSVENKLTATGSTAATVGATTSTAIGSAASSVGATAERAGDSAARTADRAGDSISRAAGNVGDAAADAAITAKVKTAFLADSDVKGLKIDVDTSNGVVTLTGTLDARANIQRAEDIAKKIDGVKSVNNKLTAKAS